MSVYHITYAPQLKEVCLYFNTKCNFSCYGCITERHPLDCHLEKSRDAEVYESVELGISEVISYFKSLSFKRVIFLGKEPTVDKDFFSLAKILKEKFLTYNILLTNGWEYVESKFLDEVCVSIKAMSEEIFRSFTGKDEHKRVLDNFVRYADSNIKLRAESIFIPEFIDKQEIEKIARFIAGVNKDILYRIDAYIPYKNDRFRRPTKGEMEETKRISEKYLRNVSILYSGVKIKYKVKKIY